MAEIVSQIANELLNTNIPINQVINHMNILVSTTH